MNPKYRIGRQFMRIDNADTCYITVLATAPELNSDGEAIYFVKVLCMPDEVTGYTDDIIDFEVMTEKELDEINYLYIRRESDE